MLTDIQHRKQIFSSAFSNLILLILVVLFSHICNINSKNKMLNFPPSSNSLIRVPSSGSSDEKIPYYAEGLGNRGPGPKKRKRLTHLSEEEKVMRRKWKNRQAAQSARDRKKQKMEDLEQSNYELKHTSQRLLQLNQGLVAAIKALQQKVEQLSSKLGVEVTEEVADIKHFEQEMQDIIEKKNQDYFENDSSPVDMPEIKEEVQTSPPQQQQRRKFIQIASSPVTIRRPIAINPANHPTNHKPVILTAVQSPSSIATSKLVFSPSQHLSQSSASNAASIKAGSPEPAVSRGHLFSQQQKQKSIALLPTATSLSAATEENVRGEEACKDMAKLEVKREWEGCQATGGRDSLKRVRVSREALTRLLLKRGARRSSLTWEIPKTEENTSRSSSRGREGSSSPSSAPGRKFRSCCGLPPLQLREIPRNVHLQCPPLVKPIKVERQ